MKVRVTCASFKSCGRGSGPRSVSSNSRTRSSLRFLCALCVSALFFSSFSFSINFSAAAPPPFQAITRCVLRFLPCTLSRISMSPRRCSRCKAGVSTPILAAGPSGRVPFFSFNFARNAASPDVSPCDNSPPLKLSAASRPASVKITWRCDFSSVTGGSIARNTSPAGAR